MIETNNCPNPHDNIFINLRFLNFVPWETDIQMPFLQHFVTTTSLWHIQTSKSGTKQYFEVFPGGLILYLIPGLIFLMF